MIDSPAQAPFIKLSREEWKTFRKNTPMTISALDVSILHGQVETVSLTEIEEIFLPLMRLLYFHFKAKTSLHHVSDRFLGRPQKKIPFIIGITGSVSVGKSTTSRILKVLLEKWTNQPSVQILTTDSFLYRNTDLEKKGLMDKKGFPESFDKESFLKVLLDLKSGSLNLNIPIYSHQTYDILPDQYQTIDQPDIVIVEGLNIFQPSVIDDNSSASVTTLECMDFSIYVDAKTEDIKGWFLERFMYFRENAKSDTQNFYHQFSMMTDQEAMDFASNIWKTINEVNLNEHILPLKKRANLILSKGKDHQVREILLRMV